MTLELVLAPVAMIIFWQALKYERRDPLLAAALVFAAGCILFVLAHR
jgi:predicted MFS family arabinose efflux permease